MSVKLLLDENLSPAAAVALAADGIDACHVRDRGILGASDHDVLERAYQEDRVFVTSNVADFVKLATAREIHAGIVLVERGGLLRDEHHVPDRRPLAKDEANRVVEIDVAVSGPMQIQLGRLEVLKVGLPEQLA